VEYSLTVLGQSLMPVIETLGQWADKEQVYLREVIEKQTV
jgi:DNA-binding HxlR family transcriptional regulator